MTAQPAQPPSPDPALALAMAHEVIVLLVQQLGDGLDHPELWREFPGFVRTLPALVPAVEALLERDGKPLEPIFAENHAKTKDLEQDDGSENRHHALAAECGDQLALRILGALCQASPGDAGGGDLAGATAALADLAAAHSQSALVQGALFHLQGLANPADPKFRLAGKFCTAPFMQMDVLESSTHLCCASWLHQSVGDLNTEPWPAVWNSLAAQAVRASVLDGSYRYCNKIACPKIQGNELPTGEIVANRPDAAAHAIAARQTVLSHGPQVVNLAYDRTCNLACPSCRSERIAADHHARARYGDLQDQAILPMLKTARLVCVTGSGDPFASKNFRHLLSALNAQDYPALRFQIMTNGMLFTPAQWRAFPALHGRVEVLRISTDGATAPTHELLRQGSRWEAVLENLRFAGELVANGQITALEICFTVQLENFCEMGAAVDLAKQWGATGIDFGRMTNWGTFSAEDYRAKAVFLPGHPDHAEFLEVMQDSRLQDPIVLLRDLAHFVETPTTQARRMFRQ